MSSVAADWSVENTRIISELFAEHHVGNRTGNYLTPNAFDEVGKQFKMRTGLDYTYTQLKNKWDKLKGDFSLFKKLKFQETGAGWDYVNNTVSQDDEWWKNARIDIKGCGKFKKKGLANEQNLRIIFGDITSDGSMYDTSVLFHAIENDKATFPHPPKGKYYLVDAGYPNRDGYLAPYKRERYHVPDFQRGASPNYSCEQFGPKWALSSRPKVAASRP